MLFCKIVYTLARSLGSNTTTRGQRWRRQRWRPRWWRRRQQRWKQRRRRHCVWCVTIPRRRRHCVWCVLYSYCLLGHLLMCDPVFFSAAAFFLVDYYYFSLRSVRITQIYRNIYDDNCVLYANITIILAPCYLWAVWCRSIQDIYILQHTKQTQTRSQQHAPHNERERNERICYTLFTRIQRSSERDRHREREATTTVVVRPVSVYQAARQCTTHNQYEFTQSKCKAKKFNDDNNNSSSSKSNNNTENIIRVQMLTHTHTHTNNS